MNLVSVSLFDRDGATLANGGLLPTALSVQWLDELADAGSFSFSIPAEDGDAIEVGRIVKFAFGPTSDDYVWAGVVERIAVEEVSRSTDSVVRILSVSGRGARVLLEDAVVYNSGAVSKRDFTAASAGEIMQTFVDEAQTRGALDGITYDFTDTLDSNGDAYAESLTVDVAVGNTLYQVAQQHQELAVDLWVGPDLALHYVNERGADLTTGTNPTVLRVGQSVGQVSKETGGPVRNTVLVATGADGTTFATEDDAGSVATYGRRETYLALSNSDNATYATLASTKLLLGSADPAEGVTIQLDDNGPLPYLDFSLGDRVYLAGTDGTRTSYRVRSVSVQVDEAGNVSFVPELGSARADLTRRLERALSRIEAVNAAGQSDVGTAGGLTGLGGGGGGGTDFQLGEVLTYNATTETGTADIDGITYNFDNATGFGLGVGDLATLIDIPGLTDKVVMGVYDRAGSYTPIVINNPQAVAGFPFDGDQLPNDFNYVFDASGGGVLPANYVAGVGAWYGSGVLGYAGRVVVFLSRRGTTAQVPIIIYDVETGSSTALNRTPSVGTSNRSHSVGVIGTRLFVTYDGQSGNCVESWDSTTGVWTSHAITAAVYLGVSNSRAWWLGIAAAGGVQRWQVYSIDSSGTLSNTQSFGTFFRNGTSTGADTTPQVFGRAKNGRLYFSFNVTAADTLYTAATNVAAASLTFSSTTAPATLQWSNTAGTGTGALRDMNRSYTCSDIDSSGFLYFFVRTGTPTTAGFAKVNPTTLAVTTYTQLTSSTGNASDGEMVLNGGLTLAGSQVVLFGAVREDVVSVGGRTDSAVPAYWRTDGVTTNRTHDAEYIGLIGPSVGATQGAACNRPIHRDTVSSTFYFHTNISDLSFPTPSGGSTATSAKSTGPAYGEALTV